MLRFKIIDRETQKINESLIKQIFNIPSVPYRKKQDEEEQQIAHLVVTDALGQNVMGGTLLTKKNLRSLREDIRSFIPLARGHLGYVWECSTLCFNASLPKHPSSDFYHSLYEGLVEFGQQQGIQFLIMKLTADTYPPTKDIGLWPYIIQCFSKKPMGDFFYGILPLRGSFFEEYQKNWEKREKEEQSHVVSEPKKSYTIANHS